MAWFEEMTRQEVVEKIPWPSVGIDNYSAIDDGGWGFLLLFSDGSFRFSEVERPSEQEILDRWSSRFCQMEINENEK